MSIEKYGKTPIFSGKQHFYSYFQNPSENSRTVFKSVGELSSKSVSVNCLVGELSVPQCTARKLTLNPTSFLGVF